ncbi:MAG: hypothetical protein R3B74_03660 [Nitrospirales bacterium]
MTKLLTIMGMIVFLVFSSFSAFADQRGMNSPQSTESPAKQQ